MVNIKANWKHTYIENEIKRTDIALQDNSRAAILERAICAARGVSDWNNVVTILDATLKNVPKNDSCSSWQAKISEEMEKELNAIRNRIITDLGITRPQTQYIVLILMANYLNTIRNKQIQLPAEGDSAPLSIPEMAAVFTRMILQDKDAPELSEIAAQLTHWRDRQ